MKLSKITIAAGVFLVFGSSLAYADNCTGYDVMVVQTNETTDLGNGHTITTWKAYIQNVSTHWSKRNGITGECSVARLDTPDGNWQATGYCASRDKDGDTYSVSVHIAPGAEKGTWRQVAGTGKFAGKQDSGWWQHAWTDGVMTANSWGGTCE